MRFFQMVIPTHGRPNAQKTLMQFPPELRKRILVVTTTQEDAEAIKRGYEHDNVVWTGTSVKSIAAKRHWIMENVDSDFPFMMDDDMYFFARCHPSQRHIVDGLWKPTQKDITLLPKATEEDMKEMVAKLSSMARYSYHAVGLSSRMGNDRVPTEEKENTRLMHAFGINRKVYRTEGLDFREVPVREDMNIALHMLRRGYKNGVLYSHMCSPGPYDAPGGASLERSLVQSNAMARKLARVHPGLVRVAAKDYKNKPRLEVVCSWQKAFKAAS